MDPSDSANLEEQVRELRSRLLQVEEALRRHGMVAQKEEARLAPFPPQVPGPAPTPPSAATWYIPRPAGPGAPAAPPLFGSRGLFGSPGTTANDDHRSLESRIGSQWFNRIGILAVLIGMAWFLKLAVDNHWIGPSGRVLIGLAAGAGLIAWSERFQRRGYAVFAYSLKAVGSGVLYLSLWAAFSLFHLVPSAVAFAAMIVVTAFNGFMSWIQDAELLALYAIAGGLSTPLLLSTGENHEVTLFTYLLVLDVAVLVLVVLRPWSRLLFSSFVGTAAFVAGWWFRFYSDEQSARTAIFVGCFLLMFAFAPRLVRLGAKDDERSQKWEALALVLLPIVNAGLGFLAFYTIFDPSGTGWAGPWLAAGFAAFYLLLLRLPARGALHESSALLSSLHLTTAIAFLTIAFPLKAHGRWLTAGWLAEGTALLWVSTRAQSRLLRTLALLCLGLGLLALVAVNPPASATPLFNQRFGAYCAAIAACAFTAWLAARAPLEGAPEPLPHWPEIAAAAVLAVNALVLLAVGLEIHNYWWALRWRGAWELMHDYRMYAQFSYSAFFMIFGILLLGTGFWRRSTFLRWQALVLLAATIGKVFLVDVSELSQGYRVVSFLGLGALLLTVSFLYQRDWLNLRGKELRPTEPQSS